MSAAAFSVGRTSFQPRIHDTRFLSLGSILVDGLPLRCDSARFLPWFDSFEGEVFARFRFDGITAEDGRTTVKTIASSDSDYPFRERRDSSGDICFREKSWDAPPVESELRIVLEPADTDIDGRSFTGFKYWFEYDGEEPIHRLLDRQTWELGGNLDDVTVCLRNWLTKPRTRITRETHYTTVGLDKWVNLLPGNMWGRWSLLPAFDMQYGRNGILLGWFDDVSLIRTVIESQPGEDLLRCFDFHWFEQGTSIRTNPKSILYCPDVIDDIDALNLWTRVHDREDEKARRQFDMPQDAPPAVVVSHNQWTGFRFDESYEQTVAVASEFGADFVFIDAIWENGQSFREEIETALPATKQDGTTVGKYRWENMCCTFDFEVAQIYGGEAGLKALVDRAEAKGVKIMSWMATHYAPHSYYARPEQAKQYGHGSNGVYAARASGRHPDTGYAGDCWTANLNAPIAERIQEQIIGVCERTGLKGFLWDSYCNLGWWQVDYPKGDMRPQFDRMAAMHAAFNKAGIYIMPEAVVSYSRHSCCGLHGGNVYAGDQLGFSYNTNISLWFGGGHDHARNAENQILTGDQPLDELFRCYSHLRSPSLNFHHLPRDRWNAAAASAIKELIQTYKNVRDDLQQRTVLKDDQGVLWTGPNGKVLFSYHEQEYDGDWADAATGEPAHGRLQKNRIYRGQD